MKKLLVVACALALGACAAQQSAVQSADAAPEAQQAQASEDSAAARREQRRKSDQTYVTSLERRDKTGSRINRVRRRGEPEEDNTAGKRVETITGEQLEEIEERGGTVVIGGEG
ncbi:MAG: hypothetical protein F4Y31_06050 [Gammaproteobacteria bacterium]|nr:hypothetical protein [Gammaproteobacteria bacterium]MYE48384.1 hypothetical protein [Gammaproteobacteria bacterium]MYF68342.1 hypothetical protein [Gammaproteobacteria bacterium]MYK38103.1 hypothetical protein [Gammaproteobacteria bacterium]